VGQLIKDVMTRTVQSLRRDASVVEVARLMRDKGIGDVLITNPDGTLCGIVTDRDLVVRAVAEARDLSTMRASEICSNSIIKVEPTSTIDEAVALMRERAIRRIPVVENGKPVGIVSIGDLAQTKDPRSALAEISAAPPNN